MEQPEQPRCAAILPTVTTLLMLLTASGGCAVPSRGGLQSLAAMPPAKPLPANVAAHNRRDQRRLAALAAELDDFQDVYGPFLADLRQRVARDNRRHYTLAEEAALRKHFSRALKLRSNLLTITARYAAYEQAPDEAVQRHCGQLAASAAILSHELDVYLAITQTSRMSQRKCNEPHRRTGIPGDAFDTLCLSAVDPANREYCRGLLGRLAGADHPATARAQRAWWFVEASAESAQAAASAMLTSRATEVAFEPIYQAQKVIALSAANLRVDRRGSITPVQARRAATALQPGDILLRRRYGNFTNHFVPGFWTHAAIYVGTNEQMRQRGLELPTPAGGTDDPHTGQPLVIEARAIGVVLTPLDKLMDADFVLVLRPRLSSDRMTEALDRALSYYGFPYDYDFDAFTADRLTCGELVWRAYGEHLGIGPQPMARGRDMLLPDQIASQYTATVHDQRQLDFVLMLTSAGPEGPARFARAEDIP